jgi:hypothetical protein
MLHTVIPVLYAVYWLGFAPKAGLAYRVVPLWLTYPLVYCGYALLRGEVDGIYPYPFLDVGRRGWFRSRSTCWACWWCSGWRGW